MVQVDPEEDAGTVEAVEVAEAAEEAGPAATTLLSAAAAGRLLLLQAASLQTTAHNFHAFEVRLALLARRDTHAARRCCLTACSGDCLRVLRGSSGRNCISGSQSLLLAITPA